MRTETLPADVNELPLSPYRPAFPDLGPGRRLRRIIGIKEDALDWVPEERTRYTWLAAIVLNTGVLAGISMLVAVNSLAAGHWPFLIPVALGWAYLIIALDSWLISSTHGSHSAKGRMFLPRLLVSLLLGIVIAEPVVVLVFRPTIHEQVTENRQKEIEAFQDNWVRCNPVTGETVTSGDCNGFRLGLPGSPAVHHESIARLTAKRDQLKAELDVVLAEWTRLDTKAREECGGIPGAGLTGVRGIGPQCRRNMAQVDQYRIDTRLSERQTELATIDKELLDLQAAAATSGTTYERSVTDGIAKEVDEKKAEHGAIGILEELRTLGQLANENIHVRVAQWLLGLLLIVIDCMPVLAKWMGGTTTYDRLISRQLKADERLHDQHVTVCERRDSVTMEVRTERIEQGRRDHLERLHETDRAARAERESALDDETERLAARLRGDTSS